MRQLCGSEVTQIAGGFPVTQRSLEAVFGTLWNSPASLALRTTGGLTWTLAAYHAGYTVGTIINDNFGGSIANAVDWVMGTASSIGAADFGYSSSAGGGLNWGDEYGCPILQGVAVAEA
jgi:hypothetical protein